MCFFVFNRWPDYIYTVLYRLIQYYIYIYAYFNMCSKSLSPVIIEIRMLNGSTHPQLVLFARESSMRVHVVGALLDFSLR